jgi:hypothetical protein
MTGTATNDEIKYHLIPNERQSLIRYHPSSTSKLSTEPVPLVRQQGDGVFSEKNGRLFRILAIGVLFLSLIGLASTGILPHQVRLSTASNTADEVFPRSSLTVGMSDETTAAPCQAPPCYTPAKIHVPMGKAGFPSFLNYVHTGPIHVDYDKRALRLNGERSFFLGGSMHPARATRQTWDMALDEAVQNGLNLITMYVMWSDHQPLPDKGIDWSFSQTTPCQTNDRPNQSCDWSLAAAIRACADRGLFVHLRIGPYACAEYSYGGLPEWLLLHNPRMRLRRANREWLEAMESWLELIIGYVGENKLWAHQGKWE